MEVLLAALLVAMIAGALGGFLIRETWVYSMITERNGNTARLMDAQLLFLKVLRDLNPIDLAETSDYRLIASGTPGDPFARSFFRFDNAQKKLFWEETPILEQVVGTFSFNGLTTAGTAGGGANWQVNWASSTLQIDLQTTGNSPEPLRILVHPKKK